VNGGQSNAQGPHLDDAPGSLTADLSRRLEALRHSPAYTRYLEVRDRVIEMSRAAAERDHDEPSQYWQRELAGFDYMLDASPLIVSKLRHHCHHLTGVRVYDYRHDRERDRSIVEDKLQALRELGADDLLVPESPLLGGFGFEIDGALYNFDTLKFIEASLALEQGGVLPILRDGATPPTVWEIGGGWGGYAHHFKSVFPEATYVITDFPEVLLFSATYLMSVFPQATVRFHIPGDGPDAFQELEDVDFVFASNAALAETRPDGLDLTINMLSFQEMTAEQVRGYVTHAYDLACPYLYSFNRERSAYNAELESVSELVRERYWAREVMLLPTSYGKPLPPGWREAPPDPKAHRYKHLVAWRRRLA
jgi:hypothetical protein